MPAFFIAHGIAVPKKTLRGKQWMTFLLKRVKSLLVPYVLWALIYSIKINDDFVKGVLFGSNLSLGWGRAETNAVLWFLPCMFTATVFYQIYANWYCRIRGARLQKCFAAGILLVCILLADRCRTNRWDDNFFGWDIALLGCAFMIVGSCLRNALEYLKKCSAGTRLLLCAAGLVLTYLTAHLNEATCLAQTGFPYPIMALGQYGRLSLFFAGALLGTTAVLLLSTLLENNIFLQWTGRFSLMIMGAHYILFTFTVDKLDYWLFPLPVGAVWQKWMIARPSTITFTVFILCIPLSLVINWACPELNGKKILEYPWQNVPRKRAALHFIGGVLSVAAVFAAMFAVAYLTLP